MPSRLLLLLFCALLSPCALAACCGLGAEPSLTEPPPASEAPRIRTDREGLKSRVALPPEATQVRWLAVPRGVQGGRAPGPTDYQLVVWMALEPAQVDSLRARAEASNGASPTLKLTLARALLGDAVPDAPGPWSVTGQRISPGFLRAGSSFHPSWAVLREDGLLVSLHTM